MKFPTCKRGTGAGSRRVRAEILEPRRLFAAQLSLNTTTDVLSFTQQTSGVSDVVEVTAAASHNWFFDDTASALSIDSTLANAGWVVTPDGHEAVGPSLPQVSSILINTGDGLDNLTIDATSVPTTFQSTDTNGSVLSIGAGHAATDILAPITYANGSILTIDDSADSAPQTIGVTGTSLSWGAGSISYGSTVFDVLAELGLGGDSVAINDSTTGTVPEQTIRSNGADTVTINSCPLTGNVLIQGTNTGQDNLTVFPQTFLGAISESSNSGLSTLTIDDSADTVARNITYLPSPPISEVRGMSSGVVLTSAGVQSMTIKGGSGGNTWTIDSSSISDHATIANIDTGAGNDNVTIRGVAADSSVNVNNQGGNASVDVVDNVNAMGTASATASILGAVDVTNSAGSTSLRIDASNNDVASAVTVTPSQVSGLTQGVEQYAGVTSVSLVGSQAGDTFSVSPAAATAFSIDGGPFAPAPNPSAKLNVNIASTTLPAVTQSGTTNLSGSYTFSDAQPVSFTDMAQIAPIIGTISGRAYDGQNLDPVVGAAVFADENDNGVADPGEPATTTDGSGVYVLAGVPAGSVNLVVNTAGGTFVAQSKTLSVAESTTITQDFELLPTPTAGNADLGVSFVTAPTKSAITGSKGKVKFKVTNSGAAIAAGSPLVELFASADKSLDETDHPIATFSLGKIKLKPRASKTLSASFAYLSSIPTGTYFLLASVDPTNVIAESAEDNNIAATTTSIRIAPAAIDLTGQFGPLAKIPLAGQAFSMPLSLSNLGNIPANGTIAISLFASADQTLDGSDRQLVANQRFHISIKAGSSHVVTLKVPLGVTMPGTVYLIASINSTHSLSESNFANNDVVSGATIRIV